MRSKAAQLFFPEAWKGSLRVTFFLSQASRNVPLAGFDFQLTCLRNRWLVNTPSLRLSLHVGRGALPVPRRSFRRPGAGQGGALLLHIQRERCHGEELLGVEEDSH